VLKDDTNLTAFAKVTIFWCISHCSKETKHVDFKDVQKKKRIVIFVRS